MKVLFLCTGNSCCSILSKAVFNHLAPAGMTACSAGGQPKGEVHPPSLWTLQKVGITTLERTKTRVQAFLALPVKQLSSEPLKAELALIGTF